MIGWNEGRGDKKSGMWRGCRWWDVSQTDRVGERLGQARET